MFAGFLCEQIRFVLKIYAENKTKTDTDYIKNVMKTVSFRII